MAFDPRGYGKSIPRKRDFPMDFFLRDANDGAELMARLVWFEFWAKLQNSGPLQKRYLGNIETYYPMVLNKTNWLFPTGIKD